MLKIPYIASSRKQRIESLKRDIENKNNRQRQEFYSQYQTFDRVRDFEVSSSNISEFLKEKPVGISEKQYYRALQAFYLTKNNPKKVISPYINPNVHPYTIAMQNYYSQQEFLYPTQENLRKSIDFEKIKVEKTLPKEDRYSITTILKILNDSKDLTLDSKNILRRKYIKSTIYDLPLRFATACYNSRDLGNGYIDDKTPEIFKDIPKEEIYEAMDLFSTRYRDYFHGHEFNVIMEIDGKEFSFEYIKSGRESVVFRIRDDKNDTAILKLFKTKSKGSKDDITFAPYGMYGNIGMLREANMAKVVDVPELYIANPIFMPISSNGSDYMGGWAIIEDVNEKEIEDGLKFEDWLHSLGLYLTTNDKNNRLNGVLIDLDDIANNSDYSLRESKLVNQIYSRYLNYESTENIINFIKQQCV